MPWVNFPLNNTGCEVVTFETRRTNMCDLADAEPPTGPEFHAGSGLVLPDVFPPDPCVVIRVDRTGSMISVSNAALPSISASNFRLAPGTDECDAGYEDPLVIVLPCISSPMRSGGQCALLKATAAGRDPEDEAPLAIPVLLNGSASGRSVVQIRKPSSTERKRLGYEPDDCVAVVDAAADIVLPPCAFQLRVVYPITAVSLPEGWNPPPGTILTGRAIMPFYPAGWTPDYDDPNEAVPSETGYGDPVTQIYLPGDAARWVLPTGTVIDLNPIYKAGVPLAPGGTFNIDVNRWAQSHLESDGEGGVLPPDESDCCEAGAAFTFDWYDLPTQGARTISASLVEALDGESKPTGVLRIDLEASADDLSTRSTRMLSEIRIDCNGKPVVRQEHCGPIFSTASDIYDDISIGVNAQQQLQIKGWSSQRPVTSLSLFAAMTP